MTYRQAVKAGLATAIVLAVTSVLRLQYPIYAVVAVVFVMESSLTGSLRAAYTRMLGTAMGTMLAATVITVAGVNPLTLGLGVTPMVSVCIYYKFTDALKLSAMLFGLVMLQHSGDSWSFAIHRLLDTSFGIIVAIAVNLLLWPPRAWRSVHANVSISLTQPGGLYTLTLQSYFTNSYPQPAIEQAQQKLTALLRQNPQLWHDARHEPPGHLRLPDTWQYLLQRIYEDTTQIQQVAQEGGADALWRRLDPWLRALAETTRSAFDAVARAVAGGPACFPSKELDGALAAAAAGLRCLNEVEPMVASMEEVARLFTLHHAMTSIAAKLIAMQKRLEEPAPAAGGIRAALGLAPAAGRPTS